MEEKKYYYKKKVCTNQNGVLAKAWSVIKTHERGRKAEVMCEGCGITQEQIDSMSNQELAV